MRASMTGLFIQYDAWVVSLLLVAALVGAWYVGLHLGRRAKARGDSAGTSKVGDASLALMGLLLGFTFAVALQKSDQRRVSVVNDANSIGDFYTTALMLKEPI